MRYVLGMAKSSLDTRGGKGRNLELDFVRLVLAVRTKIAEGAAAHGYLLVLAEGVAARACTWRTKYLAQDLVTVLFHEATVEEQERLHEEKRLNAQAITTNDYSLRSESAAPLGRVVGEKALLHAICEMEPGVVEAFADIEPPLGVRWDFFGIVGDEGASAGGTGVCRSITPAAVRVKCGPARLE